jgi:NADPH:quinone reductase
MTYAVRFHETGGPEVLVWEEVDVGQPGPGEARVRHRAIGLNYVDTYVRSGAYPASLPSGLGTEAAGVVESVGPRVTEVKVGDRVAYSGGPQGAYSEERIMPADRLVVLPDGISDQQAAAMMLKGMTAQYLIQQTYKGQGRRHHPVPCGGRWRRTHRVPMGKVAGRDRYWHRRSDEKAELAMAHGCDHTILYTRENFVERVREISNGDMVPVVYDSVGKETFSASLDCLAPRGLMVLFGQSSGAVEPVDLGILAQKGSLYVTRPTLRTYTDKRTDLLARPRICLMSFFREASRLR